MSDEDPIDEEADRRIGREGFNPLMAVAMIALLAIVVFIVFAARA